MKSQNLLKMKTNVYTSHYLKCKRNIARIVVKSLTLRLVNVHRVHLRELRIVIRHIEFECSYPCIFLTILKTNISFKKSSLL